MRTFGEQVLHYFDRPTSGTPTCPVGGAAAWLGESIDGSWEESISADQAAELRATVDRLVAAGHHTAELTAADVPLPELSGSVVRWRDALTNGRGFVLVHGLPVDWSPQHAEVACWAVGLQLGEPGAQNTEGDLLGHVRDVGPDLAHADERLYRTNQAIRFHCDAADVVGLYCRSTSTEGGASRLVSSAAVYNLLRAERPDLAERLFEEMLLDSRQPAGSPMPTIPVVPATFDGTTLRTFMHLDYFSSVERHDGATLDDRGRRMLAAWEDIAERPGVHLDMQLAPGDLQLVSNHSVVHARSAYVDDPAAPRDLLRLWLSLDR